MAVQLSNDDMMDNFCHMIIEEYLTRKQLKTTLETFREESVLNLIYFILQFAILFFKKNLMTLTN